MSSKPLGNTLPWVLGGFLVILLLIGLIVVMVIARGCTPIPALSSCAVITLPEDSLSADFYEGDQLLAMGVNSVTIALPYGQARRINIRKITDNGFQPDKDFIYLDTMVDVSIPAGQTQNVVIAPPKDYQKGQLKLTCDVRSAEIGDDVACKLTIDGNAEPDLQSGHSSTYPLEIGPHTLHIELVGEQAEIWYPEGDDENFDVEAGQVASLTETFTRMTLLTVTIDKPGVEGDLFLDGQLIGDNVSSATAYVRPNESYTVVGSNFTDPESNGLYRWTTVGLGVKIAGEIKRTVSLPMDKEELAGVVKMTCHLTNFKTGDKVKCAIPVDGGEPVAELTPEQTTEVKVKPGVHTLTVKLTGEDAAKWQTPAPQRVTIKTGQTTDVSFSSVLLASIPPTAAPAPTVPPAINIPPVTPPPPGSTAVPTNTPKPPSIYSGTFSNFGANARAIYQRGVALGRDPKKFSKVGDCETDSPYFLIPFDAGIYNLMTYNWLDPQIQKFHGSFSRSSIAGKGSFVAGSVLDAQWSDPGQCQAGVESPLACEYRVNNPAVALIMLRTYPYPWQQANRDKYISDMRAVLDYTISQGIVPVLSTIPLIESSPNELYDMNNIIRQLAYEYNIPLWDFYATLTTLPNSGVKNSHLTVPEDGGTTFWGDDMNYGMTRRNLETLEVLHYLSSNVLK